jgi:hypothetical protein
MKRVYLNLSKLALASMVLLPSLAFAGNIPQYAVSKNANAPYAEFSDGTAVSCSFINESVVFPDGSEPIAAYTAEGFPIGFDFKLGGQVFNQFAIFPGGSLLFGNNSVSFRGYAGSQYSDGSGVVPNYFYAGMTPEFGGVDKGEISYKTTGEEGNRVLTVQFKEMRVNENIAVASRKGIYSLQIRLFEADGHLEYALYEVKTVNGGNGFFTGIHGWDLNDQILLTAEGLNKRVSVSESKRADLLDGKSFIRWDADDDGNNYSPTFVFTPVSDKTAPADAPSDLTVSQSENNLTVSCVKGNDAAATIILCSTKPFADEDLPVDGTTYGSNASADTYMIGNARVIYYSNDANPSVVMENVESGATLYFRALSVNGYPAYNKNNTAEAVFSSAQAAPSRVKAEPDAKGIKLTWVADYPVIVAATQSHEFYYRDDYEGVFGRPEGDAKVGDEIDGGGKVIYVGDASEFIYQDVVANEPTYFSVWTVADGVVSATGTEDASIPNATFPFEPAVETWPQGLSLIGWESSYANTYGYMPVLRDTEDATDPALQVRSYVQDVQTLATPELPEATDLKISFEIALESYREGVASADNPNVILPQSNEPGKFGTGDGVGFTVSYGETGFENNIATITEYNGTMEAYREEAGQWVNGTSTYDAHEYELEALPANNRIGFTFKSEEAAVLYIRNLKISAVSSNAVSDLYVQGGKSLEIYGGNGCLTVVSAGDARVDIYNMQGIRVVSVNAEAGTQLVSLPAGVYIAAGQKVVVK